MLDYVWLIPLFPAIGFVINGFFGRRYSKKVVGWVACSALGLSFLTSILIFFDLIGRPPSERVFEKVIFDWVVSGSFQSVIGYQSRSPLYPDGIGGQRGQFLHPHLLRWVYA